MIPERHRAGERGLRNAGQSPRGLEQLCAKRDGVHAVERHAAHVQVDGDERVDIEAERNGFGISQRANQKAGPDEQHHRECRLEHEQHQARA